MLNERRKYKYLAFRKWLTSSLQKYAIYLTTDSVKDELVSLISLTLSVLRLLLCTRVSWKDHAAYDMESNFIPALALWGNFKTIAPGRVNRKIYIPVFDAKFKFQFRFFCFTSTLICIYFCSSFSIKKISDILNKILSMTRSDQKQQLFHALYAPF